VSLPPTMAIETMPSLAAVRPSKRCRKLTTRPAPTGTLSSSSMPATSCADSLKSPRLADSQARAAPAALPLRPVARKPLERLRLAGVPKAFQLARAPMDATMRRCAALGATAAPRLSKSRVPAASFWKSGVAIPWLGAAVAPALVPIEAGTRAASRPRMSTMVPRLLAALDQSSILCSLPAAVFVGAAATIARLVRAAVDAGIGKPTEAALLPCMRDKCRYQYLRGVSTATYG
jgi:hypothetical protein